MNKGLVSVKWIKASVLLVLGIAVFSQAVALDINSTTDLRYFPDSNMEFSVDKEGNLNMTGDNITNLDGVSIGNDELVIRENASGAALVKLSPQGQLEIRQNVFEVNNTGYVGPRIISRDSKWSYLDFGDGDDANAGSIQYYHGEGASSRKDTFSIQTNGTRSQILIGPDGDLTVNKGNLNIKGNNITNFFNQTQCGADEAIKTVYPNGSYSCNTISSTTGKQNLSQTLETGNSAGDYNIDMAGESVTGLYGITGDDGVIRVGSDLELGNNKLIFGGGNISGGIDFNSDIQVNSNDVEEIGFLNPSGSSTNFGGNLNVGLDEVTGVDSVRFSRGIDLGEGAVTGQENVQPASSFVTDSSTEWQDDQGSQSNTNIKASNLELAVTGDTLNSVQNVSLSGDGGDIVEGPSGYLYLGSGTSLAKYDTSGNLIWEESVPGTVDGLAVNSTSIYTSTVSSDYLLKYDTSGNQIWNDSLSADGSSVGVDQDAVYVAEGQNLTKYNATGVRKWTRLLDSGTRVVGVESNGTSVYASTGEISISDSAEGELYKFDSSGNKIFNVTGNDGIEGEIALSSDYIYAGAADYTSSTDSAIKKFDSNGNVVSSYNYEDCGVACVGQSPITDLAYRDGEVYFSTTDDTLYKFDSSLNKILELSLDGTGQGVVASSDSIFVSTKNVDEIKIFENVVTYASSGDYSSSSFNAGSVQPFSELKIENVLPASTDANVTVELSNASDFSSSVSKKLELTGGTENKLLGTEAQYARFDVSLSGDTSGTPEVDSVQVKYGNSASAYGYNQIALGTDANTNAEGAVAIGYNASSNEEYLARFGNNQGGELSAEITGNLTVDEEIQNFFDQNQCADDEAIKTIYPNGSYECNSISTTTEAENLSETLEAGNTANQSIKLSSENIERTNIISGPSPRKIVDDFDDLANYNTGSTDDFSTSGNSLIIDHYFASENPMYSLSGLPRYPSEGTRFSFDTSPSAGYNYSIRFGVKDTSNYYELEFGGSSYTSLKKVSGGSASTLDSVNYSLNGDGQELGLSDFEHDISAYWGENGSISIIGRNERGEGFKLNAKDSTYESGGIGFGLVGTSFSTQSTISDFRMNNLSSVNLGRIDVNSELDLRNSRIEGFFDQDECADDEAIKTIYPNGSYACNSISSTTQAENLNETLEAGNKAFNNINLTGKNLTNVDTVKGSSPVSFGDNINLSDNSIMDVGKINFSNAGGDLLNVDQLSLSQGSSDFRLRVGGKKFLDEDFEDGELAPFTTASSRPNWSVTSNTPYGDFAAEADDPDDGEVSQMNVSVSGGSRIVFRYNFTTANGRESAAVNVAGETRSLEETDGWEIRGYEIPAGTKTLRFEVDGGCATFQLECNSQISSNLKVDDVRVFNTTENAVGVYGSQNLNTGDLNQVNQINFVQGLELGRSSNANNVDATAVGRNSDASANAVAVGSSSTASGNDAVSVGASSNASGRDAIALGLFTEATGNQAVAIGPSETASSLSGTSVSAATVASGSNSVVLGNAATASAPDAMALGSFSSASSSGSVAIGNNAVADQQDTVEIGSDSQDYNLIVNGNATAEDFISSGADIAEVYSAERDYEQGTIVSVSSGGEDVERSSRFEDVAGVVSSDPGMVLNREASGVVVALEGRVPVKVSEKVEKGEELAAGLDGRAVACETGQVEELSSDASKSKIVEAVNSLNSNQECLKASFGEALNNSENGKVEVMLD